MQLRKLFRVLVIGGAALGALATCGMGTGGTVQHSNSGGGDGMPGSSTRGDGDGGTDPGMDPGGGVHGW